MRRFFFLILFFFNLTNLNAEQIINYIDVDFILKNSNKGKKVIFDLNELNKKNKNKLKIKEDEIKELDNEIKKLENIISEKELNIKIDNLKNKINLYNKYQQNISNEFLQTKKQNIENFFINIAPTIEKYMKDNDISMVVDKKNIFIADSNYDITSEIIDIINNQD